VDERKAMGDCEAKFSAKGASPPPLTHWLASGVFFCRIEGPMQSGHARGFVAAKKVLIIRQTDRICLPPLLRSPVFRADS